MAENEYGAFSKEVALHLDINKNTLRRWSMELEDAGYEFTRNDKNQRIYYDRDLVALNDMKKFLEKTQSLESAAKAVVKRSKDKVNTEKVLSVIEDDGDKVAFTKDELEDFSRKIAEETAMKTAQLLMEKFNDSIEKRDRQLVQSMRQTLEEKHQQQQLEQQRLLEIATAKEEKNSIWSRLFGFGKKEKAKDQI